MGICYAFGFWLLGHGLWNAYRSTRASSWPTAPATITSLEIRESPSDEGTTFRVEVEYTYSVNGVLYEGSRLAFGYAGSSGRKAHQEI